MDSQGGYAGEEDLLEEIEEPSEHYGRVPFREFFVNRPPTPEFIPIQKGINQATQIEEDELFDFNIEVEPIL